MANGCRGRPASTHTRMGARRASASGGQNRSRCHSAAPSEPVEATWPAALQVRRGRCVRGSRRTWDRRSPLIDRIRNHCPELLRTPLPCSHDWRALPHQSSSYRPPTVRSRVRRQISLPARKVRSLSVFSAVRAQSESSRNRLSTGCAQQSAKRGGCARDRHCRPFGRGWRDAPYAASRISRRRMSRKALATTATMRACSASGGSGMRRFSAVFLLRPAREIPTWVSVMRRWK